MPQFDLTNYNILYNSYLILFIFLIILLNFKFNNSLFKFPAVIYLNYFIRIWIIKFLNVKSLKNYKFFNIFECLN